MSLTPTYIPTHGTLADRVVEWFKANPDEELERADVARKFDVPLSRISSELAMSVMQGHLRWLRDRPGTQQGAYRLGDGNAEPAPPPAPAFASNDLMFSISPDRTIAVSFFVPGLIDPRRVLAAMLETAAITIGKQL